VILAVPPGAVTPLVPPEARAGEPYFDGIARLGASPIVSVHLWLDRLVMDEELLGLVERPVHWIFNRNRLGAVKDPSRALISTVTSAAHALVDRDADALTALALAEVRRALPGARDARCVHARVMKEREATIAHTAGTGPLRPRARSPVEGLFLAGDFVRTGLPATLESAARSADEAAALAAAEGPPRRAVPSGPLVPLGRVPRAL
jgi:uncharacterized protein with NAD-binding domain and iron-sulfur cluster